MESNPKPEKKYTNIQNLLTAFHDPQKNVEVKGKTINKNCTPCSSTRFKDGRELNVLRCVSLGNTVF